MKNRAELNAERFRGFADIYENARPQMPQYPIEVIRNYLEAEPEVVVDLGCGTGLSTLVWEGHCSRVIGVDPSIDMLDVALRKKTDTVSFIRAFSHETGLPDHIADAVVCSQSFHWMEPNQTLHEINRILKNGGVFATVDADWPPVYHWRVEKSYQQLFQKVEHIEEENPELKEQYVKWDKNNHLQNIHNSGYFQYSREIVFSNREKCDANRLVNLAMSQGGMQSVLRRLPERIASDVDAFKELVIQTFGHQTFDIDFCYRMRVGVK
ncbi:class I SAM-dependent methyltransferase [Gorillibacterium massiliense]|uniref:class I SAM-dependent methyltransferase n=1 Tax=Gorillibacterium massiliense TaxID=1280390 RepID=UPI0004AD71C8|nr:class I SAM-dependent methyltransferase [Gorillibacterium massiliense]